MNAITIDERDHGLDMVEQLCMVKGVPQDIESSLSNYIVFRMKGELHCRIAKIIVLLPMSQSQPSRGINLCCSHQLWKAMTLLS